MSFTARRFLQYASNLNSFKSTVGIRFCHQSAKPVSCYTDKDPAPSFFNEDVQKILKNLTGLSLDKIYADVIGTTQNTTVDYQFVTESQLEQIEKKNVENALEFLQMPPVVQVTRHEPTVIWDDPEIEGLHKSKFVFTDISAGATDKDRLVVVREPNGILRHASWEERTRMNAIYNPRPRKYFKPPSIFDPEILKVSLDRHDYKFILDFACAQFEPEDPLYHRTTELVYKRIIENGHYEDLHSTRHYGPLCFYLAWNSQISSLLVQYLQSGKTDEATQLVMLFAKLHSVDVLLDQDIASNKPLEFVKMYGKIYPDPILDNAILKLEEQMREKAAGDDES